MKTLGISMIVKNESECIEACLESIKGADELVIVDTGSEDNTVEICERYTDKVFTDYKWEDDFSAARNVSLSRCTADWVLIIDADEVLKDSIESIKKLINSGFMSKYEGMTFKVQTANELIQSCRVIKNVPEIKWQFAVHNNLAWEGSTDKLIAKCYNTHFEITSGYSPAHLKDPDRSLRILTKQLEINPLDTKYMYYLSREYISRRMKAKNQEEAIEWLNKAIETLERHESIAFYKPWENELPDALYCLSLAYGEMAGYTSDASFWYKAVAAAAKSFVTNPDFQAPADTLAVAFTDMPGRMRYPLAALKWKHIADQCKNIGVVYGRQRVPYTITQQGEVIYSKKDKS